MRNTKTRKKKAPKRGLRLRFFGRRDALALADSGDLADRDTGAQLFVAALAVLRPRSSSGASPGAVRAAAGATGSEVPGCRRGFGQAARAALEGVRLERTAGFRARAPHRPPSRPGRRHHSIRSRRRQRHGRPPGCQQPPRCLRRLLLPPRPMAHRRQSHLQHEPHHGHRAL